MDAALLTGVLLTVVSVGAVAPVRGAEGDAVDAEVAATDVVVAGVVELGTAAVTVVAKVVASGDEVMCEVCLKP